MKNILRTVTIIIVETWTITRADGATQRLFIGQATLSSVALA
jgi:hypothetical protein